MMRNIATPGLTPGSPLQRLLDAPVRPGIVGWLGIRPARHASIEIADAVELEALTGVVGDHYSGSGGGRQVSLIGEENLAAIGAYLGGNPADPALLRRNVVVRGINLMALKSRVFRLGGCVLAYSGECHPCSRMETLLGQGGYNAVRGNGGILARVIEGGAVRIGDALERLDTAPALTG